MAKVIKQISAIEIKDLQRDLPSGDKDNSLTSLGIHGAHAHKFPHKSIQAFIKTNTTKSTTAATTINDYKGELDQIKHKIMHILSHKRSASIMLSIHSIISIVICVMVVVVFPIWVGTMGAYMIWIALELCFGLYTITFSLNDCKMKVPKQISKIKRVCYHYIGISVGLMAGIAVILIVQDIRQMLADVSSQKKSKESIFAIGECYFIVSSFFRVINMLILVMIQRKLFVMCKSYNITEMVDFTIRHIDKI